MSNFITPASIVHQKVLVVQTNEGIVQFALDPMPEQPITRRKGAGVNVQAKSLTTYLSGMRF
jgi:hypothetical protein